MPLLPVAQEIARRACYFAALGALRGLGPGAVAGAISGGVVAAAAEAVNPSCFGSTGPFVAAQVGAVNGALRGALWGGVVWAACFAIFGLIQPPSRSYQAGVAFAKAHSLAREPALLFVALCSIGSLVGAGLWALLAARFATAWWLPWLQIRASLPGWPGAPWWLVALYYGIAASFVLGTLCGVFAPRLAERVRRRVLGRWRVGIQD